MELNHLKYFYVVAREGGFTRAAKQLRVQQPAISKMVRQLEEALGVVLLERQKRGVSLTKSGEDIFAQCLEIFGAVERIEGFAEKEKKECSGPLRLGASDALAGTLISDVLTTFLREFPLVRPSLFTGTSKMICDEIAENRVEFGLFFTVPDEGRFQVAEVARVPFRFVVASKHARDSKVRSAFIGSREIDYPRVRSFPAMEMLREQGLKPETLVSSNNLEVHRKLVMSGLGVALLPSFLVDEAIAAGKLTRLYSEKNFSYPLRLVTRRGKVLSTNSKMFLERFREALAAYTRRTR